MSQNSISNAAPDQVDVRGPRFAAWVTTAVLIVTLLLAPVSTAAAGIVLGLQAVVFAVGYDRRTAAEHSIGEVYAGGVRKVLDAVQGSGF